MAAEAAITLDDGLYVGEDVGLVFTVRNAAGAAIDITGMSFLWLLVHGPTNAVAKTKTTASGIELTTPGSGVLTVALTEEDTEDFVAEDQYHQYLWRSDEGLEKVVAEGPVMFGYARKA